MLIATRRKDVGDHGKPGFQPVHYAQFDSASVIRRTSLPARMVPECKNNLNWTFYFAIPIAFFVKYGDNVNPALSGQTWRANITKCADDSSHPHWVSWQKLSKLDFHLPECYGELTFE